MWLIDAGTPSWWSGPVVESRGWRTRSREGTWRGPSPRALWSGPMDDLAGGVGLVHGDGDLTRRTGVNREGKRLVGSGRRARILRPLNDGVTSRRRHTACPRGGRFAAGGAPVRRQLHLHPDVVGGLISLLGHVEHEPLVAPRWIATRAGKRRVRRRRRSPDSDGRESRRCRDHKLTAAVPHRCAAIPTSGWLDVAVEPSALASPKRCTLPSLPAVQ